MCKKQARGSYNPRTGIITWLYKTTVPEDVTNVYNYDRMLKLNIRTGAFYPWTIPASDVKIHAVLTPDVLGQSTTTSFDVIDSSLNNVVDSSSNQVVAFNYSTYATRRIITKYLVSYASGASYLFTWAESVPYSSEVLNPFLDWYSYDDVGVDYSSYFISGYKLRGDGIRSFQANYLYLFSDTSENQSTIDVSARWDYSNDPSSGRWPNTQRIRFTDQYYDFQRRKLKVRGHGITVQFKCESITGEPFNITGWSIFETQNTGI